MIRHFLQALPLFLVSSASTAAQPADLALRFVDLMRYKEQYLQYQAQCIAMQRTVSPEALVAKNPAYFGGIAPGHPQWSAVIQAYGRYFKAACSRPTEQEFLGALARSYEANLTATQLQSAIAYYSSPTGQALILAHRQATSAVYETWSKVNAEHLASLNAEFYKELAALTRAK